MSTPIVVAYYRVSTQKQGRSGLGLEAQRSSVSAYLRTTGWTLLAEYTEVETGKASNALERRPQLRAAIDHCRRQKAKLVIAKLDRLARNVHFVSGLIESGIEFVAADMPHASKTMLQIYAAMSEWERDAISKRTREALAAAKARGIRLGATGARNLRRVLRRRKDEADEFAERLRSTMEGYRQRGLSQRQIVADLNALGVTAPGGKSWHLRTVQRVLYRLTARGAAGKPQGQGAPFGTTKEGEPGRSNQSRQKTGCDQCQ